MGGLAGNISKNEEDEPVVVTPTSPKTDTPPTSFAVQTTSKRIISRIGSSHDLPMA